jgi:hypothetical protein
MNSTADMKAHHNHRAENCDREMATIQRLLVQLVSMNVDYSPLDHLYYKLD